MYKNRKVNAIISAAGSGTRFGGTVPKQFINIGAETVLETAVRRFDEHPWVDSIIVVASEEYREETRALLEKFPKVDQVVTGGKERQDSIRNGLEALVAADGNEIALVHDAARPFVTCEIIDRVTEKAALSGAAIPVVAVKDTIRQSKPSGDDEHESDRAGRNDAGSVSSVTLDRSSLHIVQTPQSFRMDILREAYRRAASDGFYGTDDAGLVDRISNETGTGAAAVRVEMVEGDYRNIKITTPEDLPGTGRNASSFAGDTGNSADGSNMHDLTALIGRVRTGTGFDVHQLVEGRKCILGGVDIPYEKGLLGHSDADVLVHAVMDALLGAAGLGDIGRHFPDTDERYKGISSILLLKHVTALLNENGFAVGNIDATVICQKPKIAPHIEQMKRNMADAMNIDPQMINIKGTTTEHLGFTGRGEGIASEAVCTIFHR